MYNVFDIKGIDFLEKLFIYYIDKLNLDLLNCFYLIVYLELGGIYVRIEGV